MLRVKSLPVVLGLGEAGGARGLDSLLLAPGEDGAHTGGHEHEGSYQVPDRLQQDSCY